MKLTLDSACCQTVFVLVCKLLEVKLCRIHLKKSPVMIYVVFFIVDVIMTVSTLIYTVHNCTGLHMRSMHWVAGCVTMMKSDLVDNQTVEQVTGCRTSHGKWQLKPWHDKKAATGKQIMAYTTHCTTRTGSMVLGHEDTCTSSSWACT